MGQPDGSAPAPRAIVLAASAGGVEALSEVVAGLTPDLPAGVVVVLHMPTGARSRLPEILTRAGPLPASHAADGATLRSGEIVVAPPDRHVILAAGRVWLVDGPRENGVRPAADPLFRSAARTFDSSAIGVVLSGTLDDGSVGLAAIATAGGTTIVQDPYDAVAPGMPRAAIETARVDHILPAREIGPLLARLVAAPLGPRRPAEMTERDLGPTDISCPDCGGVLRRVDEGDALRFRCRVGHSYAPESLIAAQGEAFEAAMYAALRGLEDQSSAAERVARDMRARGLRQAADRFDERQRVASERAAVIRGAIEELGADNATNNDVPTSDGDGDGDRWHRPIEPPTDDPVAPSSRRRD